MLILAKLAGILVIVWFFQSGKKMGEPGVTWAIVGLIGYWLAWWIGNEFIISSLVGMFSKSKVIVFLITQIPMIFGVFIASLVRKRLIKIAENKVQE